MYICDSHIYSWSITQKFMLFYFVFCHSVQEQIGNRWFRVFTRSYLSSLLNIYLCCKSIDSLMWRVLSEDNLSSHFLTFQSGQYI